MNPQYVKLYHYSATQYPVLQTVENRQVDTHNYSKYLAYAKQTGDIGGYHQHLSFFIEPVPVDIWRFYPTDHPVWAKGTKLFLHHIYLEDAFPGGYKFTETPLHQKRVKGLPDELSDAELIAFKKALYKEQYNEGEMGTSFIQCATKIRELTKNGMYHWYLKLKNSVNYEEVKYKYAANIPHLMMYPASGQVPVMFSTPIVIGERPVIRIPR